MATTEATNNGPKEQAFFAEEALSQVIAMSEDAKKDCILREKSPESKRDEDKKEDKEDKSLEMKKDDVIEDYQEQTGGGAHEGD